MDELEVKPKPSFKKILTWLAVAAAVFVAALMYFKPGIFGKKQQPSLKTVSTEASAQEPIKPPEVLDFAVYDRKLLEIANLPTTTASSVASSLWPLDKARDLWPVKTVYPNAGALLPFNRIVAYYGNLYSKNMGILGEYPEEVMLKKLGGEVKKWQEADPNTPVIPALHYIAVVAQSGPGRDNKFRARMPDTEIDKVLAMAERIHGIVFLDVQVGLSNVQSEVPLLEKYLKLPNVHLGIDPEFSMKSGAKPGTAIGTLDAKDINFAADFLSKIVKDNNLPPKILIIHRFTQPMVTNFADITPLPEVQIVMNMDGFGGKANKLNTYQQYIYKQPVQFTGFKLFYKNDVYRGNGLLSPADLLKLTPAPVYIQYQ